MVNPPNLVSPSSSEQVLGSGSGIADVNFRWENSGGIAPSSFNLQIAKSPSFISDSMILVRDSITARNFVLSDMPPGTYYWRIRSNTNSGQVSDWSEPGKFTIIRNISGNEITASDWKVENIGGNIFIVGGKTKPGATVRISGRETFATGDGSFQLQISSASSQITVEISDEKEIAVVTLYL